MEYKDYLEQAKKYLSGNDGLTSYREYYDKAVNALEADNAKAKQEINDAYLSDSDRAVTQSRMNSKNIDQYMASRGLARSGEAEQERINENLSLNNSLNTLAKEKNKSLRDAENEHRNSLLSLEKELVNKEYEAKLKANDEAVKMADRQLEMDNRDEDIELDKQKAESEHSYNEYMKRLEAELEELAKEKQREYERQKSADERAYKEKQTSDERAYNEKLTEEERAYKEKLIAEEREYEKEKLEDEREYEERLRKEKEAEKDGKYTPKQSAEALAKEVVKTYTRSGEKIATKSDRIKIFDFLEEFKNGSNATDEYINELESSLRSLGYKSLTKEEQTARTVVKEAKGKYDEWYYDEVARYDGSELPPLERAEKAKEAVLFKQLDYCWLHTSTKEEFESCYDILGVDEKVKREYESRFMITDPETGKTTIRKPKGE